MLLGNYVNKPKPRRLSIAGVYLFHQYLYTGQGD